MALIVERANAEALAVQAVALQAELERERAAGTDPDTRFAREYRFAPRRYIEEILGWHPWGGEDAARPGQVEVLDAYALALRQQIERRDYQLGLLGEDDLQWWRPGGLIQNRLRLAGGVGTGKTILAAGILNHFFDTFTPSICLSYATGWTQIRDLLWREIRDARVGKDLPGRILTLGLDRGPKHFAKGQQTSNVGETGVERLHGQHGDHMLFIIDEAEGVADFVFDAVNQMATGGIVIILMLGNPRTDDSRFHHEGEREDTVTIRLSSLDHPNVVKGYDEVPGGAVSRAYVDDMIDGHCEAVAEAKEEDRAFTVPWRPGALYKPDGEFLWTVLGIAPPTVTDDTLIPRAVYDAAVAREAPLAGDASVARIGVDVARFGLDKGTIYVQRGGEVWRAAQLSQADTLAYAGKLKELVRALIDDGVTSVHVRLDGTGGYAGGIADQFRQEIEWGRELARRRVDFQILEVQFGAAAYRSDQFANKVTELYAEAVPALRVLAVRAPPNALGPDLCARRYKWVNSGGRSVRILEPKELVKARLGRSPDDGDGFVLAAAADHVVATAAAPPGRAGYEDWVRIGAAI